MDLLNNHRTIRKYKNELVSENILHSVINAGTRASTTGNMQLYSVVITKDKEMKNKLAPLHFNQPVIKSAPVVLTVCADFNRFIKWCELNKANHGYDNFLSFLTASIDALLVAQNICIASEDKGLGICYLGTTTYSAKEIINVLKLPKYVFPITTITLGWPDEDPRQTDRLPLQSIIHNEFYTDYSEDMIRDIYAFKENLEESKIFVQENKKENLAQVFTDVRYKKQDNEFFSEKIIEALKQQGFLP